MYRYVPHQLEYNRNMYSSTLYRKIVKCQY